MFIEILVLFKFYEISLRFDPEMGELCANSAWDYNIFMH